MEKEKGNDDGIPDQENSLDFSEHFNQLELLETHGHLIPTGTQSLWLTTVRRLLSEKATHVNTRDEDEYTPLHRAAYSGHLDIVQELIAQGADVHAVTVDGWTPLHSACKWNNTRVASFLLQHDADINAQT
ncbi:ankyrin repeat domain 49, partial [Homo sapiens]